MDFINKVKKLKETTKSPEVSSLCENFLNNSFSRDNLMEGLGQIKENDDAIGSFLRENIDLHTEARKREMEASKKLASSLMESWGSNKSSKNSGTWVTDNRNELNTSQVNRLNESLSGLDGDRATNSFLLSESVKDLGVLKAINKISVSPISEHFGVKIMLENYRNLISTKGIGEYHVIDNFIKDISDLQWDKTAKSVYESLINKRNDFDREIEVSKVIDSIKNSGSREFYDGLYESLNNWMVSEDKSNRLLVKNISMYSFNPAVRNLINFLNVNEGKTNASKLNIPELAQNESYVERVYSPVFTNDGSFGFYMNGSIFEANQEGIYKISADQAFEKFGGDFLNIVSIVNDPIVRIDESGVNFYIGKKLIKITEGLEGSPNVYLGKTQLKFKSISELGKLIGLEVSSTSGYNDMKVVNQVISVYENLNSIVELDFAKSLVSRIYEGLRINLFKWDGSLYLQKVNEAMKENSVYRVNAVQAVKMVKESLRYDISQGLTEFLEGELRSKSILVNDRTEILSNIGKVEKELNKIQEAMKNPIIANEASIKEAEALLKRELKVLRNKWSAVNEEIDRIENDYLEIDMDLLEDDAFSIGDYVKIKESGETGKIISVDNTSGRYTILTDAGKTEDHRIDEIQDLEEALNKAADDNEMASKDEEGEEEIKESNGMAVAPETGKKVKSEKSVQNYAAAPDKKKSVKTKPQQPNLVEAPEEKSDKPMAKDLKNPKAANFAEGVDGQKPTKFDVNGYEIGYNNVQESNDSNIEKAPVNGTKAKETNKPNTKQQNLASPKKITRNLNPETKKVIKTIASNQGLSEAPGKKGTGEVDFDIDGNHMGYNIHESEAEKKN
jgi:hypothetical protein